MLDFRRATSYTPDFTLNLLELREPDRTRQFLADHWLLSANIYYRHLVTDSVNGNVSDNYLSEDYSGPPIDCAAAPLTRADLAYCDAAQNATSHLVQRTAGFGAQLTDSQDVFGWKNQGVFGADYSDARDSFAQSFQYGDFAPDRTLIYTASPLNNQTVISLGGTNKIAGVYFTDTLSPNERLHLTTCAALQPQHRNAQRLQREYRCGRRRLGIR